jgi:hypothetical protein
MVIFNMSNRRQWGSRSYRLRWGLSSGTKNVIAERRYTYISSAYEIDWTFDIMIPISIPSNGNYDLLIEADGANHTVDRGCSIMVTDY